MSRYEIAGVTAIAFASACSSFLGIDDFTGAQRDGAEDQDPAAGGSAGIGGTDGAGGRLSGTDAWALCFGASSSQDVGQSVVVNDSDDVIVTGTIGGIVDFGGGTLGTGELQLFVTRLSSDGEHIGSVASAGDAMLEPANAAIDNGGNVIVAGSFSNGTFEIVEGSGMTAASLPEDGADIFVAAISEAGAPLWLESFTGSGDQRIAAMATDPNDGAVVLVGALAGSLDINAQTLTSAGDDDVLVVRLMPGGAVDWAQSFGAARSQQGAAVAIDENGDIWITGTFDGTFDLGGNNLASVGSTDVFIARFDRDGNHEASARFGTGGRHTAGHLVPVEDNVVMVGSFTGTTSFGGDAITAVPGSSTPSEDIFVVSLDREFGHRWSRSFGGTGTEVGHTAMVDSAGNIVVGGTLSSLLVDMDEPPESAGGDDALVLKLDASGELLWATSFGRNEDDAVAGIAIDSTDAIIAAGQFVAGFTLGNEVVLGKGLEDVFVAKILP